MLFTQDVESEEEIVRVAVCFMYALLDTDLLERGWLTVTTEKS